MAAAFILSLSYLHVRSCGVGGSSRNVLYSLILVFADFKDGISNLILGSHSLLILMCDGWDGYVVDYGRRLV